MFKNLHNRKVFRHVKRFSKYVFKIIPIVKTSPEFDQYLFDHREEILAKKNLEYDMAIAHGQAILEGKDKGNPYGVTCPNCKATNVRKITVANKAVHTSIFGFWSMGRNSKRWHCDHCGSEF